MENLTDQREIEELNLEDHLDEKSDGPSQGEKAEYVETLSNTANNESTIVQSCGIQTDTGNTETVQELKNQLGTLMNSLATLSAEKSKMEANFQVDKKQLRNERDEYEKLVKDLKEKLKKTQNTNYSDTEHIKCKLIMERHEREKEQADHAKMIKYVANIKKRNYRNWYTTSAEARNN
ncbi:GRIP and coiled-coil domain-containing protein 1 isoform X2 [Colletes gigas]|uniref:GRIP and coiled-coil domain-containing protein 1 isoform X2 n=1 Tax=Colletes gigas TaxID=935657 RepID=UPI001C9BAF93|nr:GRIP and coiled-coil domain-containing protein 1 isoform X2 [Colletes gigas]